MTVQRLRRWGIFVQRHPYVWILPLLAAGLVWGGYELLKLQPTRFTARLRTESISFDAGDWPDSAGIFNSDVARVDITLQEPSQITSEEGSPPPPYSTRNGFVLRNVKLLALDLSGHPRVSLDVEEGALHFMLEHPEPGLNRFATVMLDEKSSFSGAGQDGFSQLKGRSVVWWLSPKRESRVLEFAMGLRSTTPASEKDIPVAENGPVSFRRDNKSRIVGADNTLESPERVQHLEDLSLDRVSDAKILDLALHVSEQKSWAADDERPQIEWLDVRLTGRSKSIVVKTAGSERQLADSRFTRLWPAHTSNTIKYVGTALSALVAITTLFTFVKKEFLDPAREKKQTIRRLIE